MNITLTSLEALILKATHETLPQPDAAALEAFCVVMRDSTDGPQLAAQALAARIHSTNAREALLALTMLDRCMRRCDSNFHAEVGKFRFLNEMIKLVSPKYFADRTAPEVRTRVLQLLHAWSIEYPKETKFKVAFDMLKNQGVIKETPPPLPPEDNPSTIRARTKSEIFEDEEKSKLLQKLLQSKKPKDLRHANRLIKSMVEEEERRSEANSFRIQEVNAALDSAGLLRDMLEHAENASSDEVQLIHELYASCARLRPVLHQLATRFVPEEHFNDVIQANELLNEVITNYHRFVDEMKTKSKIAKKEVQTANGDSLLDFAGANTSRCEGDKPKNKGNNAVIDELGDIFSSESSTSTIAEPMKPVNLMSSEDAELLGEKNKKVEAWHELDSLSEQLLKQSLPGNAKRLDNFNCKHTKKIPMNALEKSSPVHELQNNSALLDLDFFTKKSEEGHTLSPIPHSSKSTSPNDDVMVDISSDDKCKPLNILSNDFSLKSDSQDNISHLRLLLENDAKINNLPVESKENANDGQKESLKNKISDIKPLTDIDLTIQSVHPSKISPLTVFEEENGLTVVLHFCKDKPRPDVNVIVVSTTSKNSYPIEDFKFQVVVPKGWRARLLAPSGRSLPPRSPFAPPPALTQLLLLARAAPVATPLAAPLATPLPAAPPPLRFVLSYSVAGDSCSEIGEAVLPPLNVD
ncbi:ADP-ribosylation factor-binding protein GGA3 [Melitaea cinxia]|uniref:ADP-ribosylation factor-binding protein GGA3 n=1 Tax=Melitaea cinxia TaxID=113334 RepID=UPI001E274B99|nr:ADP-ribosylation factor-binding protein GGA3 [Melitaea cinxia]